jgi:hypothetical protein
MPEMSVRAGLTEGGAQVILQIDRDGEGLAHVLYDAFELDDLLNILSKLRAGLPDPIPPTCDPGSRLAAVDRPAWRVIPPKIEAIGPRMMLVLRHPGFGWIASLFPPEIAREIGQALVKHSQDPLPPAAP